jgi:hypothetical protein
MVSNRLGFLTPETPILPPIAPSRCFDHGRLDLQQLPLLQDLYLPSPTYLGAAPDAPGVRLSNVTFPTLKDFADNAECLVRSAASASPNTKVTVLLTMPGISLEIACSTRDWASLMPGPHR